MDNISYHNGGYDILNNDIMILQDQVTPLYKRGEQHSSYMYTEAADSILTEAKEES